MRFQAGALRASWDLGMKPLLFPTTLIVIGYSFLFSLLVKDLVKYVLVRRIGVRW
jgi:hypothetical protein